MARRTLDIDPRIGNKRVSLNLTRGQIKTNAHLFLETQAMMDNSYNIIAYGSSQKSKVFGNPLTTDQKRRAQLGLWGDTFKMIFLEDIGATDSNTDWCDYVMDRIARSQLPRPTDFYAGSLHEARWYESHFAELKGEPSYTRGLFKVWENETTGNRIHILDRTTIFPISSSEARSLIERRDDAWKSIVPAKLWDFYEWEYPPELRTAIALPDTPSDWPNSDDYPVGTKGMSKAFPGVTFILRDDGRWRPRTDAESGKSLGD